jgi:hypothetical protein
LFQQQQSQHDVTRENPSIDVRTLRQRFVGRVFDSAPAHYGGRINGIETALQHITPITERNRLLDFAKKLDASLAEVRHHEFWNNLCRDPIVVPELYLYSEADHLTACGPLEEFIEQRRDVVGRQNVWTQNFRDSEHCCHLLKYPEQYEAVLEKFLSSCTPGIREIDREATSESALISKM